MKEYKVGQIIKDFIKHQEGAIFDVEDQGASLIIFFNNPTEEEKEQFESGHRFEI